MTSNVSPPTLCESSRAERWLRPWPRGEPCVSPPGHVQLQPILYSLPELSECAKYEARFGRCAWPTGHGHNYELTVSMAGGPNRTGHGAEPRRNVKHRHPA